MAGEDGTIYSAWIDADLQCRLVQLPPDGTNAEQVLRKGIRQDRYHVKLLLPQRLRIGLGDLAKDLRCLRTVGRILRFK